MKTKDIHQVLVFKTTPLDLYKCMMDARIHSSFTGAAAMPGEKEGDAFTAFDGYITGRNVVLERGKKIVQLWRADEEGWPADHYSEVAFVFSEDPEGCRLDLYHMAVPEAVAGKMDQGWHEYYWEPLRIYLDR